MKAKSVVLTKPRKDLIQIFKQKYTKSCPAGSGQWILDLHFFLAQYDSQIQHKDVVRWCMVHSWINAKATQTEPAKSGHREGLQSSATATNSIPGRPGSRTVRNTARNSAAQKRQKILDYYQQDLATQASTPQNVERLVTHYPHESNSNRDQQEYSGDSDSSSSNTTTVVPAPAAPATKSKFIAVGPRRIINRINQLEIPSATACARESSEAITETDRSEVETAPRNAEKEEVPINKTKLLRTRATSSSDLISNSDPILEQIPYPSRKENSDNSTGKKEYDYGDPRNLQKFNQAFSSIRFLAYMCYENERLRPGLNLVSNMAKLLTRVYLDVAVPVTYAQAHKDRLARMKTEQMETAEEANNTDHFMEQDDETKTTNSQVETSESNDDDLPTTCLPIITIHEDSVSGGHS